MLGSRDLFAICFMGLFIVAAMISEDIIKGLLGTLIGLLLGAVGMDLVLGVNQPTFAIREFTGGLQSTALMMSLFAIREIMDQACISTRPARRWC